MVRNRVCENTLLLSGGAPVLVHGEGPEHDLEPDEGLLEEQLAQGGATSDPSGQHIAVDLEVNQTCHTA